MLLQLLALLLSSLMDVQVVLVELLKLLAMQLLLSSLMAFQVMVQVLKLLLGNLHEQAVMQQLLSVLKNCPDDPSEVVEATGAATAAVFE